jgi:hypothetical protein
MLTENTYKFNQQKVKAVETKCWTQHFQHHNNIHSGDFIRYEKESKSIHCWVWRTFPTLNLRLWFSGINVPLSWHIEHVLENVIFGTVIILYVCKDMWCLLELVCIVFYVDVVESLQLEEVCEKLVKKTVACICKNGYVLSWEHFWSLCKKLWLSLVWTWSNLLYGRFVMLECFYEMVSILPLYE